MAHPYGMKAMRKRKRVETDARDAYEPAKQMHLELRGLQSSTAQYQP